MRRLEENLVQPPGRSPFHRAWVQTPRNLYHNDAGEEARLGSMDERSADKCGGSESTVVISVFCDDLVDEFLGEERYERSRRQTASKLGAPWAVGGDLLERWNIWLGLRTWKLK